jgi:hypothetical protein
MHQPIQTSAYFLDRSERWLSEKPFHLDYAPEAPAVKSNVSVGRQDIIITDIRGQEEDYTFVKNGFSILRFDCSMSPEDFADDIKVKQIYLRDVAESVKTTLGASRVQIYDYIVSCAIRRLAIVHTRPGSKA